MNYYVYLQNVRTGSSTMFTLSSKLEALNIAKVMSVDMICTVRENREKGYAPVIYENETYVREFENRREYIKDECLQKIGSLEWGNEK